MKDILPRLASFDTCTGCSACCSACQFGAISMRDGEWGFRYPYVDEEKCKGCHLCESVCPLKLTKSAEGDAMDCYAARTKDLDSRMQEASGGAFNEFAKIIINDGGVVYGCVLDDNLVVKHVRGTTTADIVKMYGSKYVQSCIGNVFYKVKEDLKSGRRVLFTGTPCQISGLKSFLGEEDENLWTMDLICHGVPSQSMFEKMLGEIKSEYPTSGKIVGLTFRNKDNGWGDYAVTCMFSNGKKVRGHGRLNAYLMAFLYRLTLRRSCYRCAFNAGKSGADVTVGDFWGIDKVYPSMSDGTGVSAIIAYTRRGAELIEKAGFEKMRVSVLDIARSNLSFRGKRRRVYLRTPFLWLLSKTNFAFAWRTFAVVTLPYRAIRRLARVVMLRILGNVVSCRCGRL